MREVLLETARALVTKGACLRRLFPNEISNIFQTIRLWWGELQCKILLTGVFSQKQVLKWSSGVAQNLKLFDGL